MRRNALPLDMIIQGDCIAAMNELPENSVRVIAPDVGGGFGTKGKHYPEETILAWAARKLHRTLKWVSTRSEAFVSDYQARDHFTRAEAMP